MKFHPATRLLQTLVEIAQQGVFNGHLLEDDDRGDDADRERHKIEENDLDEGQH